ncbi:hypothetical protein N657DRAFT_228665 [Parathielavia appendiculata]|uniref:Uncharacterized protein n=1 Tax=Parathielavia appendiculata TaxID=2587402 RepID=A0AAN6Z7E5_9PEZI|nr:hypothetical protein N657DRAFT_228665 [Parathielavia appendiculata]
MFSFVSHHWGRTRKFLLIDSYCAVFFFCCNIMFHQLCQCLKPPLLHTQVAGTYFYTTSWSELWKFWIGLIPHMSC